MLEVHSFNRAVLLKYPCDRLHRGPRRDVCQKEGSVPRFQRLFCSDVVGFEEELMAMLMIGRELEHHHSEVLILCSCHQKEQTRSETGEMYCITVMLSLRCSMNSRPIRACAVGFSVKNTVQNIPTQNSVHRRRLFM